MVFFKWLLLTFMYFANDIITVPIIATHRSPLKQKFGTPRQPNLVAVPSQIVMHPPFDTHDAFNGINKHSHLWVIWQFHQNRTQANFRPQVRPPRLGGNEKMGVFATRSMYRPSQLGLSVVELVDVFYDDNGHGVVLSICGADMIDGTPIIDIKPYLPYSDSIDANSPMALPTTKTVLMSDAAKLALTHLENQGKINHADAKIICQLIAQDPRPAYRQANCGERFVMRYANVDVLFFMDAVDRIIVDDVVLVV